jgi:DNA-binding XRE family transcriptional regulator
MDAWMEPSGRREPADLGESPDPREPSDQGEPGDLSELGDLPILPGFREMAIRHRRMTERRRRLIAELVSHRRETGLSQTQIAARMGTSQSAVARLETGDADVRASTLERYAAALGRVISWQADAPPQEGSR